MTLLMLTAEIINKDLSVFWSARLWSFKKKKKEKEKAADQMLMLFAFVISPDEGAGKQLNNALFFSHLTIN